MFLWAEKIVIHYEMQKASERPERFVPTDDM